MSSTPYIVSFGNAARTVRYEENSAVTVFTFDLALSDINSILLEHHTFPELSSATYALAFERCQAFLESKGYKVRPTGEPRFEASINADEVQEAVGAELERLEPQAKATAIAQGHFLVPVRGVYPSDTTPEQWRLWRVYEDTENRFLVVYDERTKQYGVVAGGVFRGFWGNLAQTLHAVSAA